MLTLNKKIIIFISCIIILSCSQEIGTNNTQLITKDCTVQISIPLVSDYIAEQLVKDTGVLTNSRGFFFANKFVATLYSNSQVVQSENISTDIYSSIDSGKDLSITIPAGTYTLKVDIYNINNSDTIPVVSGISDEFTVLSGQVVPVSVSPIPVNAESITLGESILFSEDDFLPTVVKMTTQGYEIIPGSEKWYSFIATSNKTKVDILSNNLSSSPFNYNTKRFSYTVLSSSGQRLFSNDLFYTQVGETYYIGILFVENSISLGQASDNLISPTITADFCVKPAVDFDDLNDNIAAAIELSPDNSIYTGAFEKIGDIDYFKFSGEATKKYKFKIKSSYIQINQRDANGFIVYSKNLSNGYNEIESSFLNSRTIIFECNSINSPYSRYTVAVEEIGQMDIEVNVLFTDSFLSSSDLEVALFRGETLIDSKSYDNRAVNTFVTFDLPEQYDQLSLKAYLRDDDGNLLAVAKKDQISEINTLILDNTKPAIDESDVNTASSVNTLWSSAPVNWTEMDIAEDNSIIGLHSSELILKTIPENSQLTIDDFGITDLDNKIEFSFTPDSPGLYKIRLLVSDGVENSFKDYYITALADNEGVINVKFN